MARSEKLKSVIVDLRQKLNKKNQKKKQQKKKFSGCHKCGGEHKIRHCQKLLDLSIIKRREEIKTLNLCENCLIPICGSHICKAGPCKVCGGFEFHNSVLCFLAVH